MIHIIVCLLPHASVGPRAAGGELRAQSDEKEVVLQRRAGTQVMLVVVVSAAAAGKAHACSCKSAESDQSGHGTHKGPATAKLARPAR